MLRRWHLSNASIRRRVENGSCVSFENPEDLLRAEEFSHFVHTYFRMVVPETNSEDPGGVHEAICPAGFNQLLRCCEYNISGCIADGGKASSRPDFRRDPGSSH